MSRRLYILLSSFLFYQIRDLQAQWKVRDLVLGLRQKWHSEDILSRFFLILQGGSKSMNFSFDFRPKSPLSGPHLETDQHI